MERIMNYKPSTEFYPLYPFYSLFKREMFRIQSVLLQVTMGPTISSLLYLLVFGLQIGRQLPDIKEFSYVQFMIPGLILMVVIRGSFMNTSHSLFFYRYIGGIVELLVLPARPFHFILAFTLATTVRGFLVAFMTLLVSSFFTTLPWTYPGLAILMIILTSMMCAQIGLLIGLLSETWESLSCYDTFIFLPLIYMSGVFYPIGNLPPLWQSLSYLNPIYYIVDGFRYAALGFGNTSIYINLAFVGTATTALFCILSFMFLKGYKLQS